MASQQHRSEGDARGSRPGRILCFHFGTFTDRVICPGEGGRGPPSCPCPVGALPTAGQRAHIPALGQVRAAVAAVGELADQPRGTLRLSASGSVESFLSGPTLHRILAAYPEVRLEIIVGGNAIDIVRRATTRESAWGR